MEWAWQPPKSYPIPVSLIFSKDPAPLLELGPLVTHSTFSASDYVYDHIFNYSREHMLMLIHLQIEEHCESQEPYGFHLQREKRCVEFLTPLAPNKIKFTPTAGHGFGASKMRAGTCSQHSVCIPWDAQLSRSGPGLQGTMSPICNPWSSKHSPVCL